MILPQRLKEEVVSTRTRSSRVTMKPLTYLKDKRCVYGDERTASGRYPMNSINKMIELQIKLGSKVVHLARSTT